MRKLKVESYTVELLEHNEEIREEHSSVEARCGGVVRTKAARLTFFRSYPVSARWQDISADDILGYAVLLKQDLPNNKSECFILEAVVRPPTIFVGGPELVSNYYPHCTRDFESTVGYVDDHKNFSVRGSFFCQQNGLTHVCAHACIRMAINSSPVLFGAPEDKLTNGRINTLLGINHTTKKIGNYEGDKCGGLIDPQIMEVINKLGWSCHFADFAERPGIEYAAFIYPVVESRLPVILGIDAPGVSHVVTILGHTLNSDRWEPEAKLGYGAFPISEYASSAAWADHFIMSDDNFGMYVTLPSDMIRNFLVPQHNPNLHASSAIAIVPRPAAISGYLVEALAAILAEKIIIKTNPIADNKWLAYLRQPLVAGSEKPRTVVCRTVLVLDKDNYVAQIAGGDSNGKSLCRDVRERLGRHLPDRFWVTEITVPDLYAANKHKLGDVITKAGASREQFLAGDAHIFCWLPGLARWGEGLPDPQEAWPLMGHVPLYRQGANSAPRLEW